MLSLSDFIKLPNLLGIEALVSEPVPTPNTETTD